MPLDSSFTKFVDDNKLVHEKGLAALQGTRLAIDARHWLNNDVAKQIKEPYQAVLGGAPLTLSRLVEQRLAQFKKVGITPIFVFSGLPTQVLTSPQAHVQSADQTEIYRIREAAWAKHHAGNTTAARDEFAKAGGNITSAEFYVFLIKILRENKVEFMRAPYLQWTQMAYWVHPKERLVHHVYGPHELIMLEGVDAFITDIDMDGDEPSFKYIQKEEVRAAMTDVVDAEYRGKTITDSQFLDICLLAGLTGQLSSPRRFESEDGAKMFAKIVQMVLKFEHGVNVLESMPNHDSQQHTNHPHLKLRAILRHGMVLTWDGQCLPLSQLCSKEGADRTPTNLSDIWGLRLPNIVYYFMSVGAVQTAALASVVQGKVLELLPAGVDTTEYRDLLRKIFPLKKRAFEMLHGRLQQRDAKYEQRTAVTCHYWCYPQEEKKDIARAPPPPSEDWLVAHNDIVGKLREDKRSGAGEEKGKIDFDFVLKHFISSRAGPDVPQYNTVMEIITVIQLHTLNYLGYLQTQEEPGSRTLKTTHNVFSEALLGAGTSEFSEYCMLFIELIRTQALSCSHFTYVHYDPAISELSSKGCNPFVPSAHHPQLRLPAPYKSLEKDSENQQRGYDRCCLLVSRVWSLLPMQLSDKEAWDAEVSKDLVAFNTLVRVLLKTLRDLVEAIGASMYVERRADVDPQHFCEIPPMLPFQHNHGTAMGVVIDYIMRHDDTFGELEGDDVTRADRLAHLEKVFPCCTNLGEDLAKGFRFWKATQKVWARLEKEPHAAVGQPRAAVGQPRAAQNPLPAGWVQMENHMGFADTVLRIKLDRIIDLGEHVDAESPPKEEPSTSA
eukprot:TRINITY_DN17519_c0_g1_i1.p1 TRINITY_DN17519_c0_g1~~TRINITY_DN17519_c0_g1_i1.p1  ORF type:complete len:866 (+),score=385.37 TRINITY_DN17519_c0_g1_i1:94-2598(+)